MVRTSVFCIQLPFVDALSDSVPTSHPSVLMTLTGRSLFRQLKSKTILFIYLFF